MKNRLLRLEGNSLVLIRDTPEKIDSKIKFEINLPQGAVLEKLTIEGKVNNCVQAAMDGENRYVTEVDISNLMDTDRLILDAYMTYLEREKQVDEIHTGLDLEGILSDILESEAGGLDEKSIREYIAIRLKNLPLN